MRRRSLPQIVIPVPCHADWNTMTRIDAAGRTRFCDSCERPVYDSKAMTERELGDLIAWHEGRRLPCVRLHRRPDGTIVTKDCFAPLVRAGRFLWLKAGVAAVAFWASALGLRSLALSVNRYRTEGVAALAATGHHVVAGAVDIIDRPYREPDSLAPLPPSLPRSGRIPSLGLDPLLPEIDRAPPLRNLEVEPTEP